MPNIIAKPFTFELNTITQTVLNKRDEFIFTKGDSVIFNITVKERDLVKDLTGCNFSLLLSYEGGQYPLEQKSVTIVNATEGKIQIKLESYMTNKLGINIFQLLIVDSDEQVATNRFRFSCVEGLSDGVVEEAQESIDTITQLNLLLNRYVAELDIIKKQVSDKSKEVDIELVEINNKLTTIDNDIIALQNRVNGVSEDIDRLPKIIDLIPTQIQGSSIWYFSTPTIKTSPLDLVKCAYDILVVGKCLNDSTVQTATIRLQFQRINNSNGVPTIKVNTSTICDFSVQGRTVNATVVFDNMSDTISASATNYKLYIKSNVLVSLNFQSEIYSSMSSLGKNLTF